MTLNDADKLDVLAELRQLNEAQLRGMCGALLEQLFKDKETVLMSIKILKADLLKGDTKCT